jgi:hypothetical protein
VEGKCSEKVCILGSKTFVDSTNLVKHCHRHFNGGSSGEAALLEVEVSLWFCISLCMLRI